MKNGGAHFAPKLGGHFKLELGGQYDWNLQFSFKKFALANEKPSRKAGFYTYFRMAIC